MKVPRASTRAILFTLILIVAAALRLADLGRLSFWYDEVVTVRLAETAGPISLLRLLGQIDATRAPLHPLLLQVWLALVGRGERQARLLSVGFDLLTIVFIERLARRLLAKEQALWASWLAAISPNLILYAREARMYSWLTLVACVSWNALISLLELPKRRRVIALVLSQTALAYSHPLGLLMILTQGIAAAFLIRRDRDRMKPWLFAQFAAAVMIAPWIHRYFDHSAEYVVGVLPIRSLLATPIGFVGGNGVALILFVGAIAWGIRENHVRLSSFPPLICWAIVPPIALYGYSLIFTPLFGPARYMLYTAPAFFILLANGLTRLPASIRWSLVLLQIFCAGRMLSRNVYPTDRHADWRGAAVWIERTKPKAVVVVLTDEPKQNHEAEVARYYLPKTVTIIAGNEALLLFVSRNRPATFLVSLGLRDGKPVAVEGRTIPARYQMEFERDFDGLRIRRYREKKKLFISPDPAAKPLERSSTKGASAPAR